MKVLHLIGGGDIGGAKTHVLPLIKELGKHIDVKLVALRPGVFADEALEMGLDIEVVRSHSIIADIRKVKRIIKDGGYQLIHSHGAKANMFSVALRRGLNLPTVTTVHSDYKLDYMHSLFKTMTNGMINSIALRMIDNYIAISRNFKDMLIERQFEPENIFTLYNGLDFKRGVKDYSKQGFIEKYKLDIQPDDILVGIAARLYPVKGIDILIKAAGLVVKQNPKIKFIIGGDGEDRQKLEKLAESLGLSRNVYFLGWLNDPYELMSIVDISVLTSLSESFAYSVLEGAKFKKATISSRVGGIPDLIEDGVNGYLFEPGDYGKLSEELIELASDPQMRTQMGEAIYQKASTKFSIENMCTTQLSIYDRILQSHTACKSRKRYDVVISGYYGFRNIGDDALLMSIIGNLKELRPGIRTLVLSKNPSETRKVYGVKSVNRFNMFNVLDALRKAKMFIYGGGTIVQDNTSTRSLFFYLGIAWLAKKMGLKVMFYGNGIGPLNGKFNRRLSSHILNQVDVITVREELSLKELEQLGVRKPRIMLTADPAVAVHTEDLQTGLDLLQKEGLPSTGPFIGFSLRKYPGHEDVEYEPYEDIIADIADYTISKYGLTPVFIPMQHPVDDEIISNVIRKMKGKGFAIKNNNSISETMSIIGCMEMLVGMRLHALIFAARQGIPVIGLEYDELKISGFLKYMKQPSGGHVKSLDANHVKAVIDDVWNKKKERKAKLLEDIELLKEKALENAQLAIELLDENPV